jgi:PleD family two-component response regulator
MAKILLVIDAVFVRVKIVNILQTARHEVIESVDCTNVFKWGISEQIDVIMLDFMMPVADGCTALRDLKIHEDTLDISVIISSSLSSNADLIKIIRCASLSDSANAA